MKQFFTFKWLIMSLMLVMGVGNVWAQTDPNWSHTVSSSDNNKLNTTAKTFTVDATHVWSYEGTTVAKGTPPVPSIAKSSGVYGILFGSSGNNYYSPVMLSTTAFDDVAITKVQLYLKHNGAKVGTLTVKQGNVTIGTATTTNTSSWIDVACSETAKGLGGTLSIQYEVAQALYIARIDVWYEDLSTDPAIGASDINIASDATSGVISYTISNPVENTNLTASVTAGSDWISNVSVDATNSKVTFATTENEDEENAREGTIHLVYGNDLATKDVTVTQAKAPKKYTVTIDNPTGGTLEVKNGNATVSTGDKFVVGTVLTIEATPDDSHKFTNWQYKKGSGSWATRTTTFDYTIDSNDVEFRANFAPVYNVNWSVNGTITTVKYEEGEAISFAAQSGIDGKTFMGWTETEISGTTDAVPTFVTEATMGTEAKTYYAVFATKNAGSSVEKTDELTYSLIGVTVTSYTGWTNKKATSDAVYAGQSAGGDNNSGNAIQLRSKNSNSGIITTTSGGNVKKIVVVWNDATADDRTLNVYGKSTTYSEVANLYNTSNQGTLLGTIVCGTSTELAITGEYAYIGLRSNDGAMYLDKISITWEEGTSTYSDYCTTVAPRTYTRDVTVGNFGTMCVPFGVDAAGIEGATFYTISGKKMNGDALEAITLEEATSLTAGVGYIFKATDSQVTLTSNFTSVDTPVTTGAVIGTFDDEFLVPDNMYILSSNKIYGTGTTGEGWIRKNRAYIDLTNVSETNEVKGIALFNVDVATGIDTITSSDENNVIFNMAGQRVTKPVRGLYIINGKKVFVK